MINRFSFSFLIMISLVFSVHAQLNIPDVKVVLGSKDLPQEMNLLINSVQQIEPTSYETVRTFAFSIDRYARLIKREDVFLLGKVEIYRTFLKSNGNLTKLPIDGNSLKTLKSALVKTKDPFIKWFLSSLIQDAQMLIDNPQFKEYVLMQNAGPADINKFRRVIKKSQLIQNWALALNPEAEDFLPSLNTLMLPRMKEALKNIENTFYLLAFQANLSPLPEPVKDEKDLKLFSLKTNLPAPAKKVTPVKTEKSVEEIIAPVLGEQPTPLPAPSAENWLEEENPPIELQKLPKPSNDADWLQDF